MGKIVLSVIGVVLVAMSSVTVLAEQKNSAPAVQQQMEKANPLVDQTATSSQTPRKAKLSARNKAKIDQAQQRKLRQVEINKERAAELQSK